MLKELRDSIYCRWKCWPQDCFISERKWHFHFLCSRTNERGKGLNCIIYRMGGKNDSDYGRQRFRWVGNPAWKTKSWYSFITFFRNWNRKEKQRPFGVNTFRRGIAQTFIYYNHRGKNTHQKNIDFFRCVNKEVTLFLFGMNCKFYRYFMPSLEKK